MNGRQHALVARQLIRACGGLREAVRALEDSSGRVIKRSRLQEFTDPRAAAFMPADVINALEAYCGQAIYSRALAEDRPTDVAGEDLADEACRTAEDASDLQRMIRLAGKTVTQLTAAQTDEVLTEAMKLQDDVAALIATLSKARRPETDR